MDKSQLCLLQLKLFRQILRHPLVSLQTFYILAMHQIRGGQKNNASTSSLKLPQVEQRGQLGRGFPSPICDIS